MIKLKILFCVDCFCYECLVLHLEQGLEIILWRTFTSLSSMFNPHIRNYLYSEFARNTKYNNSVKFKDSHDLPTLYIQSFNSDSWSPYLPLSNTVHIAQSKNPLSFSLHLESKERNNQIKSVN